MQKSILFLLVALILVACSNSAHTQQSPRIEKVIVDEESGNSGYYVAIHPRSEKIEGVLFLMSGFGQHCESIMMESDLENVAAENDILTIVYAGGNKVYLDEHAEKNLTATLTDVVERFQVKPEKFVMGGFSSGGILALRYVEKCKANPEKYPVDPSGIFMVDSPIDLFFAWDMFQAILRDRQSDIAVQEAEFITNLMIEENGNPEENIQIYGDLTPFSMNKEYGENEIHLKETAVRTYHDVDVNWRLLNRNQSVRWQNYVPSSELINRLLLMGNDRAEFMQSFKTGYRYNGQRHPHSWSIIDEEECIEWVRGLLGF